MLLLAPKLLGSLQVSGATLGHSTLFTCRVSQSLCSCSYHPCRRNPDDSLHLLHGGRPHCRTTTTLAFETMLVSTQGERAGSFYVRDDAVVCFWASWLFWLLARSFVSIDSPKGPHAFHPKHWFTLTLITVISAGGMPCVCLK